MKLLTTQNIMLILGSFLTIYLYSYMHKTFYPYRAYIQRRTWLLYPIYLAFYIADVFVISLENPFANISSTILTFMLPLFICFRVKNIRGIVYFGFYLVGIIIVEVILGFVTGTLANGSGFETHYDALTPTLSAVMNLAEIIMVLGLCRFGSKDRSGNFDGSTRVFALFPIITLLLVMACQYRAAMGLIPDFNPAQFVQLTVILLMFNVLVFIVLEKYTYLMKKQMALNEDKLKLKSDVKIIELASETMKEKLIASEETVRRDRLLRHDRRHFESLLLTLLENGKAEEAKACLSERLKQEPASGRQYCDNLTVNAALCYYIAVAERDEIKTSVSASIPAALKTDEMELAIVISNLFENAINACRKLQIEEREIKITAKYKEQLLISVENSYASEPSFDENGYPVTAESGHGIGTKSVIAFAEKTDSMLKYSAKDGRFCVRMIIDA